MECVLRNNRIDDSSWQSAEEDRNRLLNNSCVPSPIAVDTWDAANRMRLVPPRSTSLEMAICISGPYIGGDSDSHEFLVGNIRSAEFDWRR